MLSDNGNVNFSMLRDRCKHCLQRIVHLQKTEVSNEFVDTRRQCHLKSDSIYKMEGW